jgi:hypothetical protein
LRRARNNNNHNKRIKEGYGTVVPSTQNICVETELSYNEDNVRQEVGNYKVMPYS